MRLSSVASRGQPQLGATAGQQAHGSMQLRLARPAFRVEVTVRNHEPAGSWHKRNMSHLAAPSQAAATELLIPKPELIIPKYCESINQTRRRPTRTVTVGVWPAVH
eukprot:GHRR01033613.1.p1 GENE.GHRR01033613.1~~GHRR01033613.1.p1  ORF type:complete len:106 (-),score=5.99 GHRR01033613.1:362-679(-)